MLSEPITKRLILSRYLFELALQNVRSQQETGDAACVNLLQDAIEIFFVAAFDHLNLALKPKTDFPQMLDKLSDAVGGDLPYRRRLLEINRVRVSSKHDGISPNRKEIDGYVTDARKFLEELCQRVLDVDYWTISLIDLLDEKDEAKAFLQAAEKAHKAGEYAQCLADCRKAFFVIFETDYDTQKDLQSETPLSSSRAPYYARNKEYIKKNVKDHFYYVVLDDGQVDADLMKEGIDNTAFWNVSRLTPKVYRHKETDVWRVQHDPRHYEEDGFKERSGLVLSSMISILLTRQNHFGAARYMPEPSYEDVKVEAGMKIYEKADKNSAVAGTLPEGADTLSIGYATQGLNDDECYWTAFFVKTEGEKTIIVIGYALQDDLKLDE
jgi:hypothetical protein